MTQIIPGVRLPVLGSMSTGWYTTGQPAIDSTLALTLSTCYVQPFPVYTPTTFDRIGVDVTTGGANPAVVRLGIYNNAAGLPTTVLLDAGTVVSETTGVKSITISQYLGIGWWWLAVVAQAVTCSVRTRGGPTWGIAHPTGANGNIAGLSQASMTGALTTFTAGVGSYQQSAPKVFLRAA